MRKDTKTLSHGNISNHTNDQPIKFGKLLILFVVGFAMIFMGIMIFMVAAWLSKGSANFGVLIFVGPIPIVVGAGPEASWMVLFALIIAVLSIMMFLVLRRKG